MADIFTSKQKFGDFNSPLQATAIVQQANDICYQLPKEVSVYANWRSLARKLPPNARDAILSMILIKLTLSVAGFPHDRHIAFKLQHRTASTSASIRE